MPRIREAVEVEEATAEVGMNGEVPTEAPKRQRRPAPEGVTLGALEAPVPVEPPPMGPRGSGGRGRTVDGRTVTIIETVKATPGQWFLIGTYMSPQSPTKDQLLGQQGFEFRNVRNDKGAFDRYAMLPTSEGTA